MKKFVLITIILALIIGAGSFFIWLLKEDVPPVLPNESKAGKITVTSDGCCLWVEELSVSIVSADGSKTVIAEVEKIIENDIFEFDLSKSVENATEILVSCKYNYGDYYEFSEKVLEISEYNSFLNDGLLVYIAELDGAYLLIKSGDKETFYKLNHDTKSFDKL